MLSGYTELSVRVRQASDTLAMHVNSGKFPDSCRTSSLSRDTESHNLQNILPEYVLCQYYHLPFDKELTQDGGKAKRQGSPTGGGS